MIQWGGASLADDSTAAVVAAAVAAQKEAERRAIEEKMADLLATKAYLVGKLVSKTISSSGKLSQLSISAAAVL